MNSAEVVWTIIAKVDGAVSAYLRGVLILNITQERYIVA